MKSKLSAALLLTVSVLSANSVMAANNNYNQDKFKKINVCSPHVDNVQGISAEIRTIKNNTTGQEIDSLENKISKREGSISSLKNRASTLRSNKTTKERRLRKLTNNMSQLQAEIDTLINGEKANVKKHKANRDHNKIKKGKCSGGLKGSFCRKKYRSRIKDAEKKLNQATARKAALVKKRAALPVEKRELPIQIAKIQKRLVSVNAELRKVETATPSISKMEQRLRRLEKQNQAQVLQKKRLKKQLQLAENTLDKCRHQRFQSRAYQVVLEQAQVFRSRPSLCNEVDYLVDVANKEYKKEGIKNAARLVCDMALELQELNIDDDNDNDFDVEDRVIRLDREIRSPEGQNGQYKDNFRTTDKQARSIDKIGQAGISMIRLNVEFDIEKGYDYLLIKDANGNIVEKIDGQGQKVIEIQSSHAEILFYSDGNTSGRGFTISEIELHR